MKMTRRAIFIFTLSILILRCACAQTPQHSVSSSRQFVIYGLDAPSRGEIAELAEKTKSNLLVLLQRTDDWQTPIVINLHVPETNVPEMKPVSLRFSQTGAGLKLQLDFRIAKSAGNEIERELLRAILLEMIYRHQSQTPAGTVFVEPPAWLLDGILAVAPESDPAPLIEALTVARDPASLETFLLQNAGVLDPPARELYRAESYSLIRLLLDGENGRVRLARYIDNLARESNDPLADFRKYFPQLAGDDAEKTWKSSIARLSDEQNFRLLTFAETDRKLDELQPGRIEPLLRTKLSAADKTNAKHLSDDLLMLAERANPALREVVREYQQIALRLAAGKTHGLSAGFIRVKTERAQLASRMNAIDDYMNWFEATQLSTSSGEFPDHLKAASETVAPRRTDSLSVYLDALDENF
jgi:hypothetical protein